MLFRSKRPSRAVPSLVRAAAWLPTFVAIFPGAVQAQQSSSLTTGGPLAETVVTATRVAQPLSDLVADVTVVDRATIEQSGAVGIADVLKRLPGVEIVRNGGPGNATSVYLRGAESRFTAVYIDGVRIDSQATGGASWEQIPLAQIDRIEVLRGPAAAVYGSDAIGGVIQLFTRKGDGKPAPFIGIGVGSHNTRKAEAGISGSFSASGPAGGPGTVDYSLGVSREKSQGFNARPVPGQNPDKDGYDSSSANARLGLQINARQRLDATLLASNLQSRYDSSPTLNDQNLNRLRTAGLTWTAQWTDAFSTRLQATESTSRYATEPSPYLTETKLHNYLLQNTYRLGSQVFTASLERREDHLQNAPIEQGRSQNGLALGYGFHEGPHTVQLNVRHDDDSEFGGRNTGSAAYGYEFMPHWRATVSAGSAFRAPTLYQRFSEYGVASLQPETSHNVEAGIRWADSGSEASVVLYRNRVSNLISFVGAGACASPYGCYSNTAQAVYEGLTLSGRHRFGGVAAHASLDVQDPHDASNGKLLARRARRHATVGAETQAVGWTFGAETQLSSARFDDAANTQHLGGYALVSLYASTRLARDYVLQARVDNLANRDYQLARGYATGGRQVYVGLKWTPL
jgi:vitamin B12 transporter